MKKKKIKILLESKWSILFLCQKSLQILYAYTLKTSLFCQNTQQPNKSDHIKTVHLYYPVPNIELVIDNDCSMIFYTLKNKNNQLIFNNEIFSLVLPW